MTEFKSIEISKIFIAPDRLRKVDMDFVYMLNAEIVAGQFVDPILVRKTPNKKGFAYTLIDGEHRIEAVKLTEDLEIPCVVVSADKDEAEMLEAGANIFRHISALDRAIAIHSYRKAWERKHGKVRRGNPHKVNSAIIAELNEEGGAIDIAALESKAGFSQVCADRVGISERSVRDAVRIATKLPDALKDKLRGTSIADTQTQLIALTKLDNKQLAAAAKVFDIAEGDYDRLMELLKLKEPKPDPKLQAYGRIISSWDKIPKQHKWHVLDHMGVTDILTADQLKKLETEFGAPKPEGGIV